MLITPDYLLNAGFILYPGPFAIYRIAASNGEGMEIVESYSGNGWMFHPMSGGACLGSWPRLLTQQAEVRAIAGLLEIVLK